jgi:hypothetical protein
MTDPRVAIVRRWLGESNNCYGTVDGLLSRLDAARDEAGGPAWKDKPDAVGWWLLQKDADARPYWNNVTDLRESKRGLPRDWRWFGPVSIPEDKVKR